MSNSTPHSTSIVVEKKANGHYRGVPQDDPLKVGPYDWKSHESQHVVFWNYTNSSIRITFKDPLITKQPHCNDLIGRCVWNVPPGLLKQDEDKKKYEYQIDGTANGQKLDPLDPEIEVDK